MTDIIKISYERHMRYLTMLSPAEREEMQKEMNTVIKNMLEAIVGYNTIHNASAVSAHSMTHDVIITLKDN